MAILKESVNEYEAQIVNAVTGQSFKEYVKLGDREKPDDREAERYITAYPGIMFKIQITLKTGFCFKPFDAVEANLYFKGQSTYCGLAVLNDSEAFTSDLIVGKLPQCQTTTFQGTPPQPCGMPRR